MSKLLLSALSVLALSVSAFGQTSPHSVTLTWTAPSDATSSSTMTMFRATGACSGSPTFSVLASGLAVNKPYVDTTVSVGTYCYTAQHVLNGANSVNSNLASASVSPLPATGLSVTVTE